MFYEIFASKTFNKMGSSNKNHERIKKKSYSAALYEYEWENKDETTHGRPFCEAEMLSWNQKPVGRLFSQQVNVDDRQNFRRISKQNANFG